MSIVSSPTLIYNPDPEGKKRDGCFRDTGWATRDGYFYESDQLSRCLMLNREYLLQQGEDYTFFVSLNFHLVLDPEAVKALWEEFTRNLRRKGFIGAWFREVSPTDHINYHLLARSHAGLSKQDMTKLIGDCVPKGIPYHCQPEPFDACRAYYACRYVTKAKTPKYVDGRLKSRDRWLGKRTFFLPDVGLQKYGKIGKFWVKPKDDLWQEIKDKEKRIELGMAEDGAEELVEYLHDLTEGYFGRDQLRRRVGYHAQEYAQEGTLHPPAEGVFEYLPKPKPSTPTPPRPSPSKPKSSTPRPQRSCFQRPESQPRRLFYKVFRLLLGYPQYHPP